MVPEVELLGSEVKRLGVPGSPTVDVEIVPLPTSKFISYRFPVPPLAAQDPAAPALAGMSVENSTLFPFTSPLLTPRSPELTKSAYQPDL